MYTCLEVSGSEVMEELARNFKEKCSGGEMRQSFDGAPLPAVEIGLGGAVSR